MKSSILIALVLVSVVALSCQAQEFEGVDEPSKDEESSSWWSSFKIKVKSILTKWRDDLKLLWDEVLNKATDMKSWTAEMFESFKMRLKKWLESRPELPEDEKNEIETFISKLKLTTQDPKTDTDP